MTSIDLSLYQYAIIAVVTYFAEVMGAIVGGGGFVIQSFLISIGVPAHYAVANDVSAAAGTSLGSLIVFHHKRLIRWPVVRPMIFSLILGSILGLFLLEKVSSGFIEKFIATLAIGFVVYGITYRKALGETQKPLPKHANVLFIVFGFITGVYVTFSGAGAGTFATFVLTTAFGTTFVQALAIQSVIFLISMFLGFFGYLTMGLINFPLLGIMLCAAILSGITGAKLAIVIGNKWLKPMFLIAVFGFAVYLLLK